MSWCYMYNYVYTYTIIYIFIILLRYMCVCVPFPVGGSFLKLHDSCRVSRRFFCSEAQRILQAAHLHESVDFTVPGDGR